MNGTYTIQAIPPYCGEIKKRVAVVEWRGSRVLLRELDRPNMLIDSEFDSFTPDIEPETPCNS